MPRNWLWGTVCAALPAGATRGLAHDTGPAAPSSFSTAHGELAQGGSLSEIG